MNAMLDPSIVAARIQGCADSAHGTAAALERIAASSQGCLNTFAMFYQSYARFFFSWAMAVEK
jgi:hypothetical protein